MKKKRSMFGSTRSFFLPGAARRLAALAPGTTNSPDIYKIFAALGTFLILRAAKVDSPFPRLLGNLHSVVLISVIDLPEKT